MARHSPEASTTGVHDAGKGGGTGGTIVLSLLGIALFIAVFYWYHNYQRIEGSIVSQSSQFGQWTLTPDNCRILPAGDGVMLWRAGQPRLSASMNLDPEGGTPLVHLTSTRDGKAHLLEHDRCGTAHIQLHKGEDGRTTSGEVHFECAEGGMVRGDVTFRNCK